MATSGWRVVAWSPALRQGEIESDAGRLPFDGRRAAVDDLALGEPVEIELRRAGDHAEVMRLWPRAFRSELRGCIAPLPASWRDPLAALSALLAAPLQAVVLHRQTRERLELHVVHAEWPPPHQPPRGVVVLDGVAFVQLPTSTERFSAISAAPWSAVVATRAALAERVAVDEDQVEPDAVLVAFEPSGFGETAGYVLARALQVHPGS